MNHVLHGDEFRVWYDASCATIFFEGFLKLPSIADYNPINLLLIDVSKGQKKLTIDLQGLQFLNGSGISMLSRFVVHLRHERNAHLCIQGNPQILWQTRTLKNLQRLMPALSMEWN